MSHRQGLHSDDSPYPGEPLCYCDEDKPSTPSNTSFKKELEQILKGYHDRLLMTETVYDIKQRNTALTSIINLVDKEVIGEDEELPEWGKLRIDIRNELRAEMRENVWKI